MLKNPRAWLFVLVSALVATTTYVVLDRTVLGGDSPPRTKVSLGPASPTPEPEPAQVRVYVDNAGPQVSVSVRTPEAPWRDELIIGVGDLTFRADRSGWEIPGCAGADFVADPTSLISRLEIARGCLADNASVTATVTVDGGRPATATSARAKAPNILMVMVDDMRADEVQWMPNVQKYLGEQGVTFRNGFASFPLCCPARASVLTGQYPHNHGVWSHIPPWGFTAFQDSNTFATTLQAAGYHTSYLGKYLNGYGAQPVPGQPWGTSTQYCPPGWDSWRASIDGGLPETDPFAGSTYRYFDTTLNNDCAGYVSLQDQYQTEAYAELTTAQIRADGQRGRPWLNYVSFTAPHHGHPREADDPAGMASPARPQRMWGAFDEHLTEAPGAHWHDPDRSDKPRLMRNRVGKQFRSQMLTVARQRAESLYVVDEAIGAMFRELRKTGQLENTVVVFTSDNGWFLGEQGLRSGKIWPYEPSLRVPLLMRGPGLPAGEVRNDPFLSIDFADTFTRLADVRQRGTDGLSLLDVARLGDTGTGTGWSRVVLTESMPNRADTARLAAQQPVGARQTEMMTGLVTGIRTHRYLYTEWRLEPSGRPPGITVELYDVLADPDQYHNLAGQDGHEALLAEFHDLLAKARTCVGAQCRELRLPDDLQE